MKITYIGHSGFLMEWERCYWLFDYYIGEIPQMEASKRVIVFVSHRHGDHFNPAIFDLRGKHQDIEFVLSSDIDGRGTDWASARIVGVEPLKKYELHDGDGQSIGLTTLKSTDEGVAFLLNYQGRTVYHAGDLNLWVWKEETQQYNDEMTTAFDEQMSHLKGTAIDIAFVPLDPRQEEYYYMGLESLLNTAKVKYVFPMHFGRDSAVIERYKKERAPIPGALIMDISRAGQEWEIDL